MRLNISQLGTCHAKPTTSWYVLAMSEQTLSKSFLKKEKFMNPITQLTSKTYLTTKKTMEIRNTSIIFEKMDLKMKVKNNLELAPIC